MTPFRVWLAFVAVIVVAIVAVAFLKHVTDAHRAECPSAACEVPK